MNTIGKYCTISDDVKIGTNVVIYGFVNLYGCEIGKESRIGTFVEIQRNTTIGKRVRIQSHSFICSNVYIGDDVFIGHNVNFINDRYPTAIKARDGSWKIEKIIIEDNVSIGTGSTILCGVRIGKGAVVGAGSLVTKDVASHTIFAGVPAIKIRDIKEKDQFLGGENNLME